jgi:Sap-like sulfolipid-1-addressing protein
VLGSDRARINGLVFGIAFLLAQSGTYIAGYVLGAAVTPSDSTGALKASLELVFGLLLLAVGFRGRRRSASPVPDLPSRSDAFFTRLSEVKPSTAFGVGLPLGVGAKRLFVTLLAAATVAASGLVRSERLGLSALYLLLATVLVWLPVGLYVVFGATGDGAIVATRRWVTAHERQLMAWLALVLGALLVVDGVVVLL